MMNQQTSPARFATMTKARDLLEYAENNRPYFNAAAVFADETENFTVRGGDVWRFSIRTARHSAESVRLHMAFDGGEPLVVGAASVRAEGLFDVYTAEVHVPDAASYYFSLAHAGRVYYYNRQGLTQAVDHAYDFRCVPALTVPEWARGAVMYQIYVDRFCNGDPTNDVQDKEYVYLGNAVRRAEWGAPVEPTDVGTFYGGDLRGVMDKMSYLRALGVEAIYLNPVFVSPSNHKYDVQDYDYIDPHFGVIIEDGGEALSFDRSQDSRATMYVQRTTNKANLEASNRLMIDLIVLAHENGIRVILDGVFNHCGAWNKWLDKEGIYGASGYPVGAYEDESSAYHDYFQWKEEQWPQNGEYDAWWGHDNHPKLHYEAAPALRAYMLDVAAKWVSPPFNADGWRLDVAADLGYSSEVNHAFWRDFRDAVKTANPDAVILAEHYGDPSPWLDGEQWDTVMNYDAFMEPVTWFFTGMEKHSEDFKPDMLCNAMAFESAMRYYAARFPRPALETAMNQLSNHDHSRFLTRTNMMAGRLHTRGAMAADEGVDMSIMMEAVVLQMTWLGAPTLYYGDEAGLTGWTDPDNRRPFPWGTENEKLQGAYCALIHLRRESKALRRGSLEYLYMNKGIISFGRWLGGEVVVAAFNNNESPQTIALPVWKTGLPSEGKLQMCFAAHGGDYDTTRRTVEVRGGHAEVVLPGRGCVVLTNEGV